MHGLIKSRHVKLFVTPLFTMNRSASPSLFGYDFQVNAAIVLMLENIEQLDTLRVEGAKEDIEIKLNDNTYVLAQAKSVVNSSSDFKEVKQKFKFLFST